MRDLPRAAQNLGRQPRPPFALASPPALEAERGPEVDVLVAGLPGVGKTSLLFALEKEELLSIAPLVPLLPPRLNPFAEAHQQEDLVKQWRERWEHNQLESTRQPEIQGRPATSRTLFFPNILDLPGEFFRRKAGFPWLDRWDKRHPPAATVLIFKIDGTTKRLQLEEEQLVTAYRSILERGRQEAPVHLIINALDQSGLDPAAMSQLAQPLRLVTRDGALELLAEDHHRLSACLPALQRMTEDLSSLKGKGLAAFALIRAANSPVRLHYTCLRSGPDVESLRKESTRSFWQSLVDDLAGSSLTSRQSWFEKRFKVKPEQDRGIVQRFKEELEQLVVVISRPWKPRWAR